ncbi:MAG TPA: hypothetical protein ENI20_11995 [Bacteroides sp.]|nr:hypothetical protein [Bacteroides sp.]
MSENDPSWHRIYSLAKDIYSLAPWNHLFESDIFGVRIPDTGRIYFISLMGSGGELNGISAYCGTRALGQFWELHEQQNSLRQGAFMLIPQIMLLFTNRTRLNPGQLASIKSAGLKFRGEGTWPSLKEIVPGFIPDLPDGNSISDVPVILEQTLEVMFRSVKDPDILYSESDDDDEYLVREQDVEHPENRWVDRFTVFNLEEQEISYSVKYNKAIARRVSMFPEKTNIIQLDLVMLPTPIIAKGQKEYFPFALLFADKKTGLVIGNKMLTPLPDLSALYESIPGEVLNELKDFKYRPRRIEVSSPIMHALLSSALKNAGVRLMLVRFLESMDRIIASLMSTLDQD